MSLKMEEKTSSAGTKRRRFSTALGPNTASAISRRITRLAKSLKASNPVHMLNLNPTATITNISTTGSINDLGAAIIQGDDFDQRFGSHVDFSRLNFVASLNPGTTAAAPTTVRCTLVRGQSGLAFAANMSGSYSPVADNTITQVIKDVFYQVAPVAASRGFPTIINWSIKLRHRQKFSGAGAGTTTGESLFLILQSNMVAGTTAPVINGGRWEVFFKP